MTWLWPAWAAATQACAPGTYPNPAWRLVPLGVLAISALFGWLALRLMRGLWGKLVFVLFLLLGAGLGLLLLIIPGACVQ